MTTEISDTMAVGYQLLDLCNEGRNLEAIEMLYSDDIVSIEANDDAPATMKQTTIGIEAVREKNQWWLDNHEVHSSDTVGPFPHDDRFALLFIIELTPKVGPMADERFQIAEIGLYTVEDGKIVKEEFFYDDIGE